jgi:hypothetical protein
MRAFARAVADPQVAKAVWIGPKYGSDEFDFAPKSIADMVQDLGRPFSEARYDAA